MGLSGSQTGTWGRTVYMAGTGGHGFFCFALGSYGTVGTGGMLLCSMSLLYTMYAFVFYCNFLSNTHVRQSFLAKFN